MYIAILFIFLALGFFIVAKGIEESSRGKSLLGGLVILATILFFALLSFGREMLWFSEVGYTNRFWTIVLAKVGVAVIDLRLERQLQLEWCGQFERKEACA
jgi:hypothetical protein